MKRQTQTRLYHFLPVVFWLLAIGGIVIWEWYNLSFSVFSYIPALVSLLSVVIIRRIPRHTDSVQQCFQVAVLLGIAAYWLPSLVLLIIPIWTYLLWQNLFNLRSFLATLIGFGLVAVWLIVLNLLQITDFQLSLSYNLYVWIPTGSVLLAWLLSSIARSNLRVR